MISWTNNSFSGNVKSLKTNSKFIFDTIYFKLSEAYFLVYVYSTPWKSPIKVPWSMAKIHMSMNMNMNMDMNKDTDMNNTDKGLDIK